MNDCKEIRELISAMLDGEISSAEKEKVEAHIESCTECRAMYTAFAAVSESLNELEEVPPALHDDIMVVVKKEGKKKTAAWKKILPLAACLALVIFGSVKLVYQPVSDNDKAMSDSLVGENFAPKDGLAEGMELMPSEGGDMRTDGFEAVNGAEVYDECKNYSVASPDLLMSLLAPAEADNAAVDESNLSYYCRVVFHTDAGTQEADIFFCGERVYADFGDGIFLATATAQEVRELIN